SNIKSAAANTHFVVGADRKRSCHQCGLHSAEVGKWSALNRLTFTALPLRVLVCSLSAERLGCLMVMLADVAAVVPHRKALAWVSLFARSPAGHFGPRTNAPRCYLHRTGHA